MEILGLVLVVLAVVAVAVIALYNGLIRLKNRVDEAWSDIDVQLKRRYDLIPNLVETVKGYAAHESGTGSETSSGPVSHQRSPVYQLSYSASFQNGFRCRGGHGAMAEWCERVTASGVSLCAYSFLQHAVPALRMLYGSRVSC